MAAPGRRLFPILKLTPDTGITIAEATALCQWAGVRSRAAAVSSAVAVDRLRRGHDLARRLAAEPAAPVPLHGDLHPGNVLDGGAGRGLVAIDPRPCVGETAVDLVDRLFRGLDDRRLGAARPRPRARAGPRAPACGRGARPSPRCSPRRRPPGAPAPARSPRCWRSRRDPASGYAVIG